MDRVGVKWHDIPRYYSTKGMTHRFQSLCPSLWYGQCTNNAPKSWNVTLNVQIAQSFFFFFKKGRLPHAVPHWMCLEPWKLDYPLFYKWTSRACLEVLAGERSYSYTLHQRTVFLYQGRLSTSTEYKALRGTHMEQWGRKGTPPTQQDPQKSSLSVHEVTDVTSRSTSNILPSPFRCYFP